MVASITPWLSLYKPQVNGAETENQWGYDLNANFDVLDSAVGPALTHLDEVQTDLDAIYDALDTKAPIASPVLTGNPQAPTPPLGDADTSIATTAFVAQALAFQGAIFPSNAAPVMDGVAAPGTSVLYSREDHKHPVDTSRAPLNSPDLQGNPTAPTPAASTNSDILATTKFVKDQGYVTAAYVDAKPAGTTISDTPPASPSQGQTWWESDTGKYFINYNDGDTSQWVHINGPLANVYNKNEVDTKFLDKATANTQFVDVAGDTMTGDFNISKATAYLTLNVPTPATVGQYRVQINGSGRWAFGTDGTGEGGSNAGTNFVIGRFSDTGVFLDLPLSIYRANGAVTLASTVAATSRTTGALTVGGGVGVGGNVWASNFSASTGGGLFWGTPLTTGVAALTSDTNNIQFSKYGSQQVMSVDVLNSKVWFGGPAFGGANGRITMGFTGGGTQFGITFRPEIDNCTSLYFYNASNVAAGSVTNSATVTAYNTASSAELKEDLQSFDAGRIVDDTKVYDFKWKGLDERSYGVIAQQAVEVYPLAVTHTVTEEEDFWGVDYSKYVPVILQELKALRARVAELEGEKAPVAPKKRGH